MRILFLTSAHNSMSQRAHVELSARGHHLSVELALSDKLMEEAVNLHRPDLIIAPMLKRAIPESIWSRHVCLVVHPGIRGDRGPSSLDWAILRGERTWGVTILQAIADMDAGPIWATAGFRMRSATKSSLYKDEVIDAAMRALVLAVDRFASGSFRPEPLDYGNPEVLGRLHQPTRQPDRVLDWHGPADEIIRRVHSGDGSPGVLDSMAGVECYLFGAHAEDGLRGPPGTLLATRDGAICRAAGDGAVWISHVKRKAPGAFKLPATMVLGARVADLPEIPLPPEMSVRGRTFREVWYQEQGQVGHLSFELYNGAMSTEQCARLAAAYRFAKQRPTRVIVLWGGRDYFSNGIHLNTIEAAADPAAESWANINAIDDLALEILTTTDRLTISAFQGNGGAGGVMLGLAADKVFCRRSVVLNPHYKGMGNLYGSEYWTYSLPRRVGHQAALDLTEGLMAVGAEQAQRIGMVDDTFGESIEDFRAEVHERAERLAAAPELSLMLEQKRRRRAEDEAHKALASYREEELARMRENFFGLDRSYHEARRQFVAKEPALRTPAHLARHR